RVLGLVVAMGAIGTLSGCSDGQGTQASDGSLTGTFEVRVVRHFDGTSERRYFLRGADGSLVRLQFEEKPRLTPGAEVSIRGARLDDVIRVESYGAPASGNVGSTQSELVTPPTQKTRSMVVALVDTGMGGGVGITTDTALQRLLGNGDLSDVNNVSIS